MALTVSISESLTLEEATCNASVSYTDNTVKYYSKKIVEVPTTDGGITLYTCSSTGSGADYDYDDVMYSRISNLSSSRVVFIEVKSGEKYFYFSIAPGGFFIINLHDQFFDSTNNPVSTGFIESVKAEAENGAADIELLIAYK